MLKNKLSVKNNKKITQFFKNSKNVQTLTENSTEPKKSTNSNNFYVECVEIDEQTCVQNNCVEKKNSLELKLKNSRNKLEQIKVLLNCVEMSLLRSAKRLRFWKNNLGRSKIE